MVVDLILLGPKGEQQWSRMGFTPYKFPKDIARHYDITRNGSCVVDGCKAPLQAGKQQGWTCNSHDPLNVKAAKKQQGVKDA